MQNLNDFSWSFPRKPNWIKLWPWSWFSLPGNSVIKGNLLKTLGLPEILSENQFLTRDLWTYAHWDLPPSPQGNNPYPILKDNFQIKKNLEVDKQKVGVIQVWNRKARYKTTSWGCTPKIKNSGGKYEENICFGRNYGRTELKRYRYTPLCFEAGV